MINNASGGLLNFTYTKTNPTDNIILKNINPIEAFVKSCRLELRAARNPKKKIAWLNTIKNSQQDHEKGGR